MYSPILAKLSQSGNLSPAKPLSGAAVSTITATKNEERILLKVFFIFNPPLKICEIKIV